MSSASMNCWLAIRNSKCGTTLVWSLPDTIPVSGLVKVLRHADSHDLGALLEVMKCLGLDPSDWDEGISVTEDTLLEGTRIWIRKIAPSLRQDYEEAIGAKQEATHFVLLIYPASFFGYSGSEHAATLMQGWLHGNWGESAEIFLRACSRYSVGRVSGIPVNTVAQIDATF